MTILQSIFCIIYIIYLKIQNKQAKKRTQMQKLNSFDSKKSKSYTSNLQLSTMNQTIPSNSVVSQANRNRYGNMLVVFQSRRSKLLVSLGPDYWCFGIAMVLFTILYYFTINQIYAKQGYQIFGIITIIGAVIQQISYILVAFSNPGIITQADFSQQSQLQQQSKIRRFCKQCNLPMLPRSRHCSTCNVCIKGYDHHCPWTSKCIGENNLYRFYFFAAYTPIFLIFCIIMLSVI